MQIRLTVLAPRSGRSASEARSCDVLVTAPAGAALATVASGLAAAAAGPEGTGSGSVVLYAGGHRLDLQRSALGEPPLVDGAVLSLQVPAEEDDRGDGSATQLHVVAGPDAGGVHLLHGGRIRIGRSAEADVPLDDPDVSRMHCTVTVEQDGRVTVADLGSTNGTTLDGSGVGDDPVRMTPGSLLRVGESALRITTATGAPSGVMTAVPDGEGHLRVARDGADQDAGTGPGFTGDTSTGSGTAGGHGAAERRHGSVPAQPTGPTGARPSGAGASPGAGSGPGAHPGPAVPAEARIPEQGGPPGGAQGGGPGSRRVSAVGAQRPHDPYSNLYDEAAAAYAQDPGFAPRGRQGTPARGTRLRSDRGSDAHARTPDGFDSGRTRGTAPSDSDGGADGTRTRGGGTRDGGTGHSTGAAPDADDSARRRGGIGAWARRLAGGRPDAVRDSPAAQSADPSGAPPDPAAGVPGADTWPDPAALLLTALGPGPRLWERTPDHREALVIRLGTADRAGPGRVGVVPSVPVTVSLREAGSLGLAGPRERLAGLARSAVAQLAALHPPTDLEIVLVSTDRARPLEARRSDWGWLGWLPHVRPAHGQDCRLLLAYDRDQATARTAELVRRLDDGPLGTGWASADPGAVSAAAGRYDGPCTLLIVDGDPGSAALRETTARLASAGAACGVHVLCLAETAAASPASPLEATYEAACAASLAFRECGAAALLSGDVATALRLLRTARGIHPAAVGQSASRGTFAVVDAVSAAWAERFGRALAPLRADASAAGTPARQAAALPVSSRLLDELGLARATPASLMARWAAAAETTAVLGAGPRGPVTVDLATEGPHLLVEGPAGSGRTELLRATAASLAAAARPDRLGLILVDGAGGERGEGLRACTELPHTSTYLVASDPVRMREFAQALGGELKRRAELLGGGSFADWHRTREVAARLVGQRQPGQADQSGDIESPTSGTLRLRPAGARTDPMPGPTPLPRLVVIVDDFDALVAPALGSPGRPTAGSVVRALEAVARDGERLGVHLIASSARPDRTADTELARVSRLRVVLDAPPSSPAPDTPSPGRGRLGRPDSGVTPFQGGRVTGRIPRTATLRPTVVPLEWERMGDPPDRRPVRELGNGPTDLALLASALERAARSVDAMSIPSLHA
ncbi:FHA domain-containing protein [Streptomyces sp. NPDC088348]|uniref:FHA domain-containing protein n=1 Tax=Streptomyces sp. NPDC088348 TaxID=3365853 RepID=UPI00382359EA